MNNVYCLGNIATTSYPKVNFRYRKSEFDLCHVLGRLSVQKLDGQIYFKCVFCELVWPSLFKGEQANAYLQTIQFQYLWLKKLCQRYGHLNSSTVVVFLIQFFFFFIIHR